LDYEKLGCDVVLVDRRMYRGQVERDEVSLYPPAFLELGLADVMDHPQLIWVKPREILV
jgi:hypothetical protein